MLNHSTHSSDANSTASRCRLDAGIAHTPDRRLDPGFGKRSVYRIERYCDPDSECPPRVLREIPAACAANTVHLYRPACSRTMGNLPDDAADVCRQLRILLHHHDAGSDAEACARIVLAAEAAGHRKKMAIHVVTAGCLWRLASPVGARGLTPRRSVIRRRGRQPCRFGNVRKHRGPGP